MVKSKLNICWSIHNLVYTTSRNIVFKSSRNFLFHFFSNENLFIMTRKPAIAWLLSFYPIQSVEAWLLKYKSFLLHNLWPRSKRKKFLNASESFMFLIAFPLPHSRCSASLIPGSGYIKNVVGRAAGACFAHLRRTHPIWGIPPRPRVSSIPRRGPLLLAAHLVVTGQVRVRMVAKGSAVRTFGVIQLWVHIRHIDGNNAHTKRNKH